MRGATADRWIRSLTPQRPAGSHGRCIPSIPDRLSLFGSSARTVTSVVAARRDRPPAVIAAPVDPPLVAVVPQRPGREEPSCRPSSKAPIGCPSEPSRRPHRPPRRRPDPCPMPPTSAPGARPIPNTAPARTGCATNDADGRAAAIGAPNTGAVRAARSPAFPASTSDITCSRRRDGSSASGARRSRRCTIRSTTTCCRRPPSPSSRGATRSRRSAGTAPRSARSAGSTAPLIEAA